MSSLPCSAIMAIKKRRHLMLKYPCLVLDHDDTVVASESNINYPFFCYMMKEKGEYIGNG